MITDKQVEAALNTFMGSMWRSDWFAKICRRDMRAALEAAERAAWEPIETAQRDGRACHVMLWDSKAEVLQTIARWRADHRLPGPLGPFTWLTMDGALAETVPSHWRHLPEGPVIS
jgi:hypothetical protein